jgi:hypothetical protein
MSAKPATLPVADEHSEPAAKSVEEQIQSYLRRLHFQDPELVARLASDCLQHAQRRVGRNDPGEWLRRALEEAQRRLDQALARALELNLTREPAAVAGARAALLLGSAGIRADELFLAQPLDPVTLAALEASRPVATPPEAPAAMPTQKLSFVFFKNV